MNYTGSKSSWKGKLILGIIFIASMAILGSNPSLSMKLWGLFNGQSKQIKQAQEMGQQIAEQKKQKETSNRTALEKAGKDRFAIIETAFKESEQKGIETFGKSSALELYSIANNPELRKSMTSFKESIRTYLSKLPKIKTDYWEGVKGNTFEIATQLKYNYFSEACIQAETQDETEKQLLSSSLGEIEKAFRSLEGGNEPEYDFTIRTTKNGKSTPLKLTVEKSNDGKYILHRSTN